MVTWDPRGEFDSGGILNVDSPAFEGQDVKGIIDWISDPAHVAYTFPAFDNDVTGDPNDASQQYGDADPAIGMVGGSYGGGIQLVTAGIDPRVDVIVPGIAWNSLVDSLYPNKTFKTSYASLLLLGLVSTGSRINPALYPAFLLGTLVGILTPGQQALLASSGPYFLTANIDVPTLFIQGTADGLFPLQQSLNNASTLGDPGRRDQDDLVLRWPRCLPHHDPDRDRRAEPNAHQHHHRGTRLRPAEPEQRGKRHPEVPVRRPERAMVHSDRHPDRRRLL